MKEKVAIRTSRGDETAPYVNRIHQQRFVVSLTIIITLTFLVSFRKMSIENRNENYSAGDVLFHLSLSSRRVSSYRREKR